MDVLQTSLAVADASPGLAVLADRSCRSCVPCRAGSPLWCVDPLTEGRPLVAPVPVAAAEHLCSVVLAAAALMAAPPSDTVVVAALETSPLLLLVRGC